MPYFYKIQEKSTGRYYVGCRYARGAVGDDLGKTYFTSSKYIKSCNWDDFIVCYVVERTDARKYEARYLKKVFKILGRNRFLEVMINRNIAPGILNTKENIEKANRKRKISNRVSALRLLQEGRHNFQIKKHIPTDVQKKKSSERMKGNKYGLLRIITEEYKQQAAEKSRGNTNVRGKKWWNNGNQRKRSTHAPGIDWVEGYKIKGI